MKNSGFASVILAGSLAAACGDDAGPTAPPRSAPPQPLVAGAWKGTVGIDTNNRSCPVAIEIEQPGAGREFYGSVQTDCTEASLYAKLVEGLPWRIEGYAIYTGSWGYNYYTYRASLSGFVEGSPASRIRLGASRFTTDRGGIGPPGFHLEITSSAP